MEFGDNRGYKCLHLCVCVCVCVYAHMYSSTVSYTKMGFPVSSVVKNPSANAGATGKVGSIPGSGRSSGGGNGHLFQYSCLENPMERGLGGYNLWGWTVYGVAKSWTWLSMQLH